MSRVIKFRAWDKKENVMEDVNIMAWGGANALKNPSGKGIQAVVPEDGDVSKPGDFVLMQFTGLLDKNGKEIYQGDLLKVTGDPMGYGSCSYEGIVEVEAGTCSYSLTPRIPTFEQMEAQGKPWDSSSMWHVCEKHSETGEGTTEIIGNIWENPGLLKP